MIKPIKCHRSKRDYNRDIVKAKEKDLMKDVMLYRRQRSNNIINVLGNYPLNQ